MLEFFFEDAEDAGGKRESGTDGGRGKRRAVLMQDDRDVWTIQESDQQAAEAANAIAASEREIVAIHPRTQERLTHNQVVEFGLLCIKNNPGMTVQSFEAYLKEKNATTDQDVMNLLFPVAEGGGNGTTE